MKSEHEEEEKPYGVNEKDEEERGRRLWITATAASLLIIGLILAWLGIGKGLEEIFFGMALAIATAPQLWDAIKRFRKNPFNADLLMSIAAAGAAGIGVWEEGAAVLILYNVAENIEDYTVDRVKKIAAKVAALLPKRALLKKDEGLEEVALMRLLRRCMGIGSMYGLL